MAANCSLLGNTGAIATCVGIPASRNCSSARNRPAIGEQKD